MVEINPFRAYRYNDSRIKEISDVIAPPWDIIDKSLERHLTESSPFNIINLISKSYTPHNVKENFNKWITDGVLTQDEEDGFYFMKHNFKWMEKNFTRKGFFAILRLEDFKTGKIIPHERIFENYSINRYQLIKTCKANFSPIFMLYQDTSFTVEEIMDKTPLTSIGHTADKEMFEFGRILNNKDIQSIKGTVSQGNLIIADGHHRYNAALRHYIDHPTSENSFVLVFMVNINSPDVLILPTHRYIPSEVSFTASIDTFRRYFHIREAADLKTISHTLNGEKSNAFGVYENSRFYIITLKNINDVKEHIAGNFSDKWITLDTALLHEFVLPYLFDRQPKEIIYHQQPEYLMDEYKKRNSGVIFFLKAVDKQHFIDISFNKELMPQKTTYFYPKVPSGLVIYKFDEQ